MHFLARTLQRFRYFLDNEYALFRSDRVVAFLLCNEQAYLI